MLETLIYKQIVLLTLLESTYIGVPFPYFLFKLVSV